MNKLEPYDKSLTYSYALGAFPALELLKWRPDKVRRLLTHPNGLDGEGVALLRERCAALGVREEQAERVLKRESGKSNCFAGVAFEKYVCELDDNGVHVVLNNISDSGNLGTILRACLGMGVRNIAVIKPAVDIFEPKVARASMGALFAVNIREYASFGEYRAAYPDMALYPFMTDGSKPVRELARTAKPPYALIFGNEGAGLPREFASIGAPARIPMSDDIDSYNLAVSVAIGVYEFSRAHDGEE